MRYEIGVRALRDGASRIVRAVREDEAEYVITVHGEPVALLRPLDDDDRVRLREREIEDRLARMWDLADRVGDAWASEKSGVEWVEEQRR